MLSFNIQYIYFILEETPDVYSAFNIKMEVGGGGGGGEGGCRTVVP